MKIGVIADTHIPDRAQVIPVQILEDFKMVDMIIHAGDFVDLSVLDKLKTISANIKAVYGNMDAYEVRKRLTEKLIFKVGNFTIGVMHGYGAPANLIELLKESFKNDKVDIVIFGHSHNAFNERKGDILYFNPGSPTDKVFSSYNSYGIIEINDKIEAKIKRL